MTEKYKNDSYNLHMVTQAKYTYKPQKSIKNEIAIFQENEQIGFSKIWKLMAVFYHWI